ncbi:hypothetical protein CCUG62472_02562 [Mycobacteroides salmoniphilum]|uniref:Uncharacterized protein n=1 Tax=Mycobacteroides salmoniphilum TaxID=404941 RepID=A0A4V3I0X2_9MYCO|nr:hypothetical protein CCUG62472_02562 [Mycobacteroides salmoniphilum]TEA03807.1 hypothetical protein CCUG60884_02667 [Mycobacteroides salmoniphilum]
MTSISQLSQYQSFSQGYGTYGVEDVVLPPPRTSPCAHKVVPLALTQSAAEGGAAIMPNTGSKVITLAER